MPGHIWGRSMSCTPSQFRKRGRGKIVGSNDRWHNGSVAVRRWAGKAAFPWLIRVMASKLLANKGMASKDGHPPAPVGGSLEKTNATSSHQQNKTIEQHSCLRMHSHTQTPMPSRKMNAQIKIWVGNHPGAMGPVPLVSLQPPWATPPSPASGAWSLWRKSHDLENGPPRAPQP